MPELPEVETARAAIEGAALGRRIADVDDTDTYVCRPHSPGDIRAALLGRELTAAHRRGKSMWCSTSDGPDLGIHLGMAGLILVTGPDGGELTEGGDYLRGEGTAAEQSARKPEWDRFTLRFDDGGSLRLFDKRRLGRVRLDPPVEALGPDAGQVGVAEFRDRVSGSTVALKARLLDQSVVAGIGNLLADETLWQAALSPSRRVDDLTRDELTALHRALRRATRAAIKGGGVHTGEVIAFRTAGADCPRCGAPMKRGTVGGRTTWWCSEEQRA